MRAWPWLSLCLLSSAALAQTDAIASPSWQSVALVLMTACSALVAGYARGLNGRITRIEIETERRAETNGTLIGTAFDRINAVERAMLGNYHTKGEIREAVTSAMQPVMNELTRVHRRLDGLRADNGRDGEE
jgi:hypothetical protein